MGPRIITVGSLNMDLVVRVNRLPRPGETLHGETLQLIPGGKGANQAVAAARLGANSIMIGRVGDDLFGRQLKENLSAAGVAHDTVSVTSGCSSGVAIIHVDSQCENAITIVSGANGRLLPEDLQAMESVFAGADVLLLQLEIPLPTVQAALRLARRHGVKTVLDPAPTPAEGLPGELFAVDILTPNRAEAAALSRLPITNVAEAEKAGHELTRLGAQNAVLKLGKWGALVVPREGPVAHVSAFPVTPVDTTAAGDAFTAALALGVARGLSMADAARFGCAAGALATTRISAQPSMPDLQEVEQLFRTPTP